MSHPVLEPAAARSVSAGVCCSTASVAASAAAPGSSTEPAAGIYATAASASATSKATAITTPCAAFRLAKLARALVDMQKTLSQRVLSTYMEHFPKPLHILNPIPCFLLCSQLGLFGTVRHLVR